MNATFLEEDIAEAPVLTSLYALVAVRIPFFSFDPDSMEEIFCRFYVESNRVA